ncbi:CaiB/BaiF CoA-transferase family protein [Nocardia sp. NBC_00416]|uniref:CaiB/BaiF CoA-transferase family protein n=1 Tax=Nocardia sp. NBC_00416 TaxID=2975991 RepID=UPI002E247B7B
MQSLLYLQLAEPLLVVEMGNRIAVGACGSLLANLGADVVVIEPPAAVGRKRLGGKWIDRVTAVAGKRVVTASPDNAALIDDLIARADVVVVSSDEPDHRALTGHHAIICDVTAFGSTGPLSGTGGSEQLLQAWSSTAWLTGQRTGAPVISTVAALDMEAAVYAASAILAALRYRNITGTRQQIEIAVFDVAINALAAFLPLPMTGSSAIRNGNRHATLSPWNTYETVDGWVMICAPTDAQWSKLCRAMGRPALATTEEYATTTARMINAEGIDEEVSRWTGTLLTQDCERRLGELGIPCGPIVALADLRAEQNLCHRRMVISASDPETGADTLLPGNVFRLRASDEPGAAVPGSDSDTEWGQPGSSRPAIATGSDRDDAHDSRCRNRGPLRGIRVVEIGMNTVGPLTGRQLGALGATVIKVEPPAGDSNRTNAPLDAHGQSYIFAISNTDKTGVVLDLRDDDDRAHLMSLVAEADVLIENLKPGSLDRLGFGSAQLEARFPRLIYCSMNGFGHDSAYPGRPALDTVVQAMSGVLDANTVAGSSPVKLGVSLSDQLGGQFGLAAVLAALLIRDRTGRGRAIDIAMQDATAWATYTLWNSVPGAALAARVIRAADGYVAIDTGASDEVGAVVASIDGIADLTRDQIVEMLPPDSAAPVLTLDEVIVHDHTRARGLLIDRDSCDGNTWTVLETPMRFSHTPAAVRSTMPALGYRNEEIKSAIADTANTFDSIDTNKLGI